MGGATPAAPALGGPAAGRAARPSAAEPDRRRRSRSLDDYRAHGGYAALRRAFELGPGRRHPRGPRLEADGPRRRGVPDRAQVGGGGPAAPAPPLPDLQRRRVRAGHVQGSGDHGGRSVLGDRVDDDRGLRDRLRARLHLPARRVSARSAAARERASSRRASASFLGEDILGRGFSFDIELRKGAGAYICGEETAIFGSIEGYRGEPRNKPPFPVERGLFGKPTVVNNVETLVNVIPIVLEGGVAFAAIGTERSTGPKLFCVSGAVEAAGHLRGAVRDHAARSCSSSPAACSPAGPARGAARRRRRQLRHPRGARSAADVRGRPARRHHARFRRRGGDRRDRSTSAGC